MSKYLLLMPLLSVLSSSCKKDPAPCYDSRLVHNHSCPTDCPGVTGCDGKKYCNTCEAARHGISSQ